MKKIPLTQGKYALVDDDDYPWLSKYNWYAVKIRHLWYVVRYKRNGKRIFMHRQIMNPQSGQQIDHINHNGLDNRRANLRFCTQSQNFMNQRPLRKGTSKYKGVYWSKSHRSWHARLQINKKRKCLGYFDCEIDAAIAYDAAARKYFGEFACTNLDVPADNAANELMPPTLRASR